MATSGKRKALSTEHNICSPWDHDAPRGLWLTTGTEWVTGVLAGLGFLEYFEVVCDDKDDRLPIFIRQWKNPQKYNAEVACYDDSRHGHYYDVTAIKEAAESLLREAGVAKKNVHSDSMLQPCSNCDGQGETQQDAWRAWHKLHRRDWREALSAGDNVPRCKEWTDCVLCDGTGMRPVENAEPFLELIEWAQKRRDKRSKAS
jgi:hypothetical protein